MKIIIKFRRVGRTKFTIGGIGVATEFEYEFFFRRDNYLIAPSQTVYMVQVPEYEDFAYCLN